MLTGAAAAASAMLPAAAITSQQQQRDWDGLPVISPIQLLHPHNDLAHRYWSAHLQHAGKNHLVVDATVGNGHDAVVLAGALMKAGGGRLLCCDIQQLAIERSQGRLHDALPKETSDDDAWAWTSCNGNVWTASSSSAELQVEWHVGDHCALLEGLPEGSATLVVFNLGYLPGGPDKSICTQAEATVDALRAAEKAVVVGGTVSATLYAGHEEGIKEEGRVLEHAASLPGGAWSVHHTTWLNQRNKKTGVRAPALVLMQRLNAGR